MVPVIAFHPSRPFEFAAALHERMVSIVQQSMPRYQLALRSAEASAGQGLAIQALHTLGDAAWGLEDAAGALQYYERALSLVGDGDEHVRASLLLRIMDVTDATGDDSRWFAAHTELGRIQGWGRRS